MYIREWEHLLRLREFYGSEQKEYMKEESKDQRFTFLLLLPNR